METLREYLLGLCAAALICSIVCQLVKSTSFYPLVRWVTGLVLMMTLVNPLANISNRNIDSWEPFAFCFDEDLINQGTIDAQNAKAAYITDKTTSYILNKAESLGIAARVDVILSEDMLQVPVGIRIYAKTSPYLKLQLEEWIQDNLNIPKEKLIWIG